MTCFGLFLSKEYISKNLLGAASAAVPTSRPRDADASPWKPARGASWDGRPGGTRGARGRGREVVSRAHSGPRLVGRETGVLDRDVSPAPRFSVRAKCDVSVDVRKEAARSPCSAPGPPWGANEPLPRARRSRASAPRSVVLAHAPGGLIRNRLRESSSLRGRGVDRERSAPWRALGGRVWTPDFPRRRGT